MKNSTEKFIREMINEQIKSIISENSLSGLPKKWVETLVSRGCGENSEIKEIVKYGANDSNAYKTAFKDRDAIAVIIKQNNKPVFMVMQYLERKYYLFDPEHNDHNSYSHSPRRRGRYVATAITYSASELVDYIDKTFTEQPAKSGFGAPPTLSQQSGEDKKGLEALKLYIIYKDKERSKKRAGRDSNIGNTDPLSNQYRADELGYDKTGRPSETQTYINKKLKQKLEPRLEKALNDEFKHLSDQIKSKIDSSFEKIKVGIIKGYSWYADKANIANAALSEINADSILRINKIGNMYSALNDYERATPGSYVNKLKKAGVIK